MRAISVETLILLTFLEESVHAGFDLEDLAVSVVQAVQLSTGSPRLASCLNHRFSGVDKTLHGNSSPRAVLVREENIESVLPFKKRGRE